MIDLHFILIFDYSFHNFDITNATAYYLRYMPSCLCCCQIHCDWQTYLAVKHEACSWLSFCPYPWPIFFESLIIQLSILLIAQFIFCLEVFVHILGQFCFLMLQAVFWHLNVIQAPCAATTPNLSDCSV